MDFCWGPERAKIGQDGLPKRYKRANIALSGDFENMIFYIYIYIYICCCVFGTPDLPKDSQDSPEASQDASRQPARAPQKQD